LVLIGVIVLLIWKGAGLTKGFATKTPTPTITDTPTGTSTPTETPTITLTPTITSTATPSEAYNYVVQEGDTLTSIVKTQNLGDNGLILIYILNGTRIDPATGFITVGQTITLPYPGEPLPTSTPVPTGLAPGARITYRVMPGDSLGGIANKFNSTVDAIVLANKTILKDGVSSILYPGELLIVPIDLVTPVPTKTATATAKP
jgi:LysM repeat protein